MRVCVVCAMTVDVNSCSIATEYCMWTVETIVPATYVFQPSYSNCTGHYTGSTVGLLAVL